MTTTELDTSTLQEEQLLTALPSNYNWYCRFYVRDNSSMPEWQDATRNLYDDVLEGSSVSTAGITNYFNRELGGNITTHTLDNPQDDCWLGIVSGVGVNTNPYRFDYLDITESLHFLDFHILRNIHQLADSPKNTQAWLSPLESKAYQALSNILNSYKVENFDIEVTSEFTNDLAQIVCSFGNLAIEIINNELDKKDIDSRLKSEIMEALGRIDDVNTVNSRYELLIKCINRNDIIFRNGAVNGLSYLDDKRALPHLRELFAVERSSILKKNIIAALKGLDS